MPLDELSRKDIDRINSWLTTGRNTPSDKKFFEKMIFYWISFNCYYGSRYPNKEDNRISEKDKIIHVFSQTPGQDNEWCKSFIEKNMDHVLLIDKSITRDVYREQISIFYDEYSNETYREAFRELLLLVNLVRNRLFHGGKTYRQPEYGNKQVLISCCNILEDLMSEVGFPPPD